MRPKEIGKVIAMALKETCGVTAMTLERIGMVAYYSWPKVEYSRIRASYNCLVCGTYLLSGILIVMVGKIQNEQVEDTKSLLWGVENSSSFLLGVADDRSLLLDVEDDECLVLDVEDDRNLLLGVRDDESWLVDVEQVRPRVSKSTQNSLV